MRIGAIENRARQAAPSAWSNAESGRRGMGAAFCQLRNGFVSIGKRPQENVMRIVRSRGAVPLLRAVGIGILFVLLAPSESSAQMAGLIKDLFDQVTINASTPNPANPAANIDHSSHFFLGGENLKLAVRRLNVAVA